MFYQGRVVGAGVFAVTILSLLLVGSVAVSVQTVRLKTVMTDLTAREGELKAARHANQVNTDTITAMLAERDQTARRLEELAERKSALEAELGDLRATMNTTHLDEEMRRDPVTAAAGLRSRAARANRLFERASRID